MSQSQAEEPTSYPLQTAIWPQPGISTETSAHFRLKGSVGVSLTQGGADFAKGGRMSTASYYNLFNLGKWRRNAGDLPLELQLRGKGRFLLSIHLACRNRSTQQLFSEVVTLDGLFRQPFAPYADASTDAIVYFELRALSDGRLDDFTWATEQAPVSEPDLMLSVTTFRREAEVAATADRFRRFRAETDPREKVRMLIVDNGRSAEVDDGEGITVIPNENLGGSGGFTRGLLAGRASGATHVLFMDDDASIQMEAVSRTWWFLAYAQDPRTAVAGAMLNDAKRWEMGENGAHFDLGCKAHFAGLDLREREDVFAMEYDTTAPFGGDFYAGWWFFAFPVAQVEHLPFPFFVRGDDVSFSLVNDFNTFTLPGVASVQESFVDKASPQTWYLDFRSHLIHHLSLPEKERSWKELQRMVLNFYLRTALRFHYDSLSAVNLALEDVLRGPGFFDENADMAQRRSDIKAMTTTEAWQPISSPPHPRRTFLPRPVRALLLLTLNGHLLPIGGAKVALAAEHREDFRMIYGASEVTCLNVDRTKAYTVKRDRGRWWRESKRLLSNTLRLRRSYGRVLRDWRTGYEGMTSAEYWDDKLRLETAAK
ncbi:glycosyltransferase family 2 protein [Microbacterium halophytorum]|uniref:glycosyltransferase n=1 Tax=Microbacterium halophytorum TaxID=2067568 RepID=UPI000CFCC4B4|nr:glycosyltransferase [Microbacterium halophytorum]